MTEPRRSYSNRKHSTQTGCFQTAFRYIIFQPLQHKPPPNQVRLSQQTGNTQTSSEQSNAVWKFDRIFLRNNDRVRIGQICRRNVGVVRQRDGSLQRNALYSATNRKNALTLANTCHGDDGLIFQTACVQYFGRICSNGKSVPLRYGYETYFQTAQTAHPPAAADDDRIHRIQPQQKFAQTAVGQKIQTVRPVSADGNTAILHLAAGRNAANRRPPQSVRCRCAASNALPASARLAAHRRRRTGFVEQQQALNARIFRSASSIQYTNRLALAPVAPADDADLDALFLQTRHQRGNNRRFPVPPAWILPTTTTGIGQLFACRFPDKKSVRRFGRKFGKQPGERLKQKRQTDKVFDNAVR